jgi:acyl-coenzyme A thioesterase PaaI-like protein
MTETTGWPADVPRPQPPVWKVFDVGVDVLPGGEVVAEMHVDAGMTAGRGLASAGLVAMLADCILGTDAALRSRSRIATAVLTVDFVGRPPETGLLRAVSGRHGRRAGFLLTSATIHADEEEIAQVSGWFALRGGTSAPLAASAPRRPDAPAADPWPTPLGRTLGLTGFTRTPDGVTVELPHVGPLSNSGGTLHGGVAALMAAVAALSTLDDAPSAPEVLSMTCHYLRAAGGDDGPVRVTGRQIRRGRTSAVVQGDVHAADGRPAMHTVLTVALPG